MQLWIFLVNHTMWKESWGETIEVIRKKVLSDAQTHGYATSIDDIVMGWNEYDWYNTGLNPVKPVRFIYCCKKRKIKNMLFSLESICWWGHYKNLPSERKYANGPELLRSGPGDISDFLVLLVFLRPV